MVQGVDKLRRQFARVPQTVRKELKVEIERTAEQVAREMESIAPAPEIEVGWTWGAAPQGGLATFRVKGGEQRGRMSVKIYANAYTDAYPAGGVGFPALARWFEFGTAPRFHKTGKTAGKYVGRIVAQPFFYPVWRANKRRVRARLTRAVNRAVQRLK